MFRRSMRLFRLNRKSRRGVEICLCLLAFLATWALMTLLILVLQEKIFGPMESDVNSKNVAKKKGMQIVVGHYNGNLAKEKRDNLTDEQLNANEYAPVEGWGEGGSPVRLSLKDELTADDTFGINQFNLYVSDRISINRSLPDIRREGCKSKEYPTNLPTTSVIIVYHNEAYSTLLRTVSSVINRSPREALKEIILVDDFSNRTFLKKPLNEFAKMAPVTIKIIRSKLRVGLIRARLMGAQEAVGQVLTFLDSHCECTKGWLEPLLARIKEDRKAVVCPVIDVVNDRTFQYQKGIEIFRGGFNWSLQFRLYFEELGTYDQEMDIWGGENLEMSFRIWQCGGRVEILPCSHVGHIFRKASPHDFPGGAGSGKVLNSNLFRVAEVWMDDWKHLFYKIAPRSGALRSKLDVSQRIELRKKLQCKPFIWYLKSIFTDHFLPMQGDKFGRIASSDVCLLSRPQGEEGHKGHRLSVARCTLGFDLWQLWLYTTEGRIKTDEHLCLSAVRSTHLSLEWNVELKECAGYPTEVWIHNPDNGQFVHRESGHCLTMPKATEEDTFLSNLDGISPPIVTPCPRWSPIKSQNWAIHEVSWTSNY
ncbi:unnamed protein product, partial [Mesorhabditis spiculigera]